MRDWSLRAGDPLSLTLGADMRLCNLDYLNDHTWELELRSGEPPSLTIRTTYGLRARNLRLSYRFTESGKLVTDPETFHTAPRLRRFHPNFLSLEFVPFEGFEVTADYWVAESHVLAGRLTISNRTTFARRLDFDLCGLLTPLEGKAFGPSKQQMIHVLAGRTGGLEPVVFMAGGSKPGSAPQPALSLQLEFNPGQKRTANWACAAEASAAESFELARRTAGRSWEAERARIDVFEARDIIDIYTGEPDWDAALAFSQKNAFGLFFPASQHLPHPSFVRLRQPDSGYSRAGDGTDFPPAWSGQTPLDSYYLSSVLPTAADLKRGLVENFLSAQSEDGGIDGRPGLAGGRSKFLAAPLLASMAWNAGECAQDDPFLAQAFPRLLAFFHSWFLPYHDQDGDGIPSWDHVLQTGFEDNPLFDVWFPWSQALDISALFNPELESMLAAEIGALMRMAEKLGLNADLAELRQQAPYLTAAIAAAWNGRRALYSYRDRLTGASWPGKLIGSITGPGVISPQNPDLGQGARLLIQVQTKSPAARRPVVKITGVTGAAAAREAADVGTDSGDETGNAPDRQVEHLEERQFLWHTGGLVAASRLVFRQVERITVDGLDPKDKLIVRTVDTTGEDVTLFTPLWAQVTHPDHAQAMLKRLARAGEGFNRPFGIPALPSVPALGRLGARAKAEAEAAAMAVHLPWNQFIAEGMLAYGFREEAARLVTRLMEGIVTCLKHSRAFYERYHAETASGLGERGALTGFAPVGLFLKVLGVQILSPTSVRLEAANPFPWPVTILYRGLKVVRGLESTEVALPNGQVVTVTDPAPCTVSL